MGQGARGDIYRGQPFKIAFIGSSDLRGRAITQKIKEILGRDTVHIDNFFDCQYRCRIPYLANKKFEPQKKEL